MDELREALGVNPPPGRRRTTQQLPGEKKIVEAMIAACQELAQEVSTYGKAAVVLDIEDRQIERAWNEWGDFLTLDARRFKSS